MEHLGGDEDPVETPQLNRASATIRTAEQSDLGFEQRVSQFLNSEVFLHFLHELPAEERDSKVGLVMEYFIIHPDGFGLDEFLDALRQDGKIKKISDASSLIVDSIARKLGIADINTHEGSQAIFDYFEKHFFGNGYFFHGFNGVLEEDIQTQGLTLHNRRWDWHELKQVMDIGNKAGVSTILGWGGINSEGKTSVSGTADNTYGYAYASPEWFAQFVSEGWHIPLDKKKKEAYYRRDYKTARRNIEDVCTALMSRKEEDIHAGKAYPNITEQDKQILLDFFEKYWAFFAGEKSKPKGALIQRSALQLATSSYDSFDDYLRTNPHFGNAKTTVQDAIRTLLGSGGFYNDVQIEHDIPPQGIKTVDLPDYNKVFPE